MKKISILIVIFLSLLCFSCSHTPVKETYTMFAMSTNITVSFYDVKDSKKIAREIEKIYLKYDMVAGSFDSGYGGLNVYDLNQRRSIVASNELIEMIKFSIKMKEDTNGYFEPLLGRLTHAWKASLNEGKLLSKEYIDKELAIVNESSLKIEDNLVSIVGDANLDLGGIAKGYATQKVHEYLDSINVTTYFLNAGNSNIILGNKVGDKFSIGFNKPFEEGYYKILNLMDISVGTSSMEHQHSLIDGVYYSHLLNPKTGMPSVNYDAISVFGKDSGVLDAYSTACFAMELEEAKAFLLEKGYEWMAYKNNSIIYQSKGVTGYEEV